MPEKKSKSKQAASSPASVDREAVAKLAYELYLGRGGVHGYEEEDWLSAERMLMKGHAPSASPPPAPKAHKKTPRSDGKSRK